VQQDDRGAVGRTGLDVPHVEDTGVQLQDRTERVVHL
jgi:hypothetical protein